MEDNRYSVSTIHKSHPDNLVILLDKYGEFCGKKYIIGLNEQQVCINRGARLRHLVIEECINYRPKSNFKQEQWSIKFILHPKQDIKNIICNITIAIPFVNVTYINTIHETTISCILIPSSGEKYTIIEVECLMKDIKNTLIGPIDGLRFIKYSSINMWLCNRYPITIYKIKLCEDSHVLQDIHNYITDKFIILD